MLNHRFIFLLLLFTTNQAIAAERETVCAKYQEKYYSWSKNYKVEATILKGYELNLATKSSNYNELSTYVVIFWDKDQSSIVQLAYPFLSVTGQEGKDQRGVKWEIAKTSVCF